MTTTTKKAAASKAKPVAKPAAKKAAAPKPDETPKTEPEKKGLRPMHQAFVDALKGGAKAYGTVGKSGDFGGWLTIPKNGSGKSIRVSYRLCSNFVKEVARKDGIVEFEEMR